MQDVKALPQRLAADYSPDVAVSPPNLNPEPAPASVRQRTQGTSETDWQRLAHQLAIPLRSSPCRCEFARNSAGVPLWVPAPEGGVMREKISTCSRCLALAAYDAAVSP